MNYHLAIYHTGRGYRAVVSEVRGGDVEAVAIYQGGKSDAVRWLTQQRDLRAGRGAVFTIVLPWAGGKRYSDFREV